MIGKIIIGKSFRGCICYCLEDKRQSPEKNMGIKNRAKILSYNLCYGDKLELIKQFNEVKNLNPKLSKPVMHITISLPPGEHLCKGKLASLVEDCSKDLGFEKNQYISLAHNDTIHQHIHIVANRVGFDGRTLKDSNNYQKIAEYCRRMELKYDLKQVLSPRRFLAEEFRDIPRLDTRKELLRQNICECLTNAKNYQEFEQKMNQRHYKVFKARGIAFIDPQKVRVKGSEVGYALSKIEKILSLHHELKKAVLQGDKIKQEQKLQLHQQEKTINHEKHLEKHQALGLTTDLLKPPSYQENISPALLLKKRKKKRSLHL